MSHTPTIIRARPRAASVGAIASIQRVLDKIVRSWKRRRQLAHVAQLDDHLLADIGLSPEEVNSALPFTAHKARAASQLAASQSRRF